MAERQRGSTYVVDLGRRQGLGKVPLEVSDHAFCSGNDVPNVTQTDWGLLHDVCMMAETPVE
jgi:hypothetical protein